MVMGQGLAMTLRSGLKLSEISVLGTPLNAA